MVQIDPASFRDPCGFVFTRGDKVLRQINSVGRADYQRLMDSGFYERAVDRGWLIPHRETDEAPITDQGWLLIEPQPIPFVSYPYEWSSHGRLQVRLMPGYRLNMR